MRIPIALLALVFCSQCADPGEATSPGSAGDKGEPPVELTHPGAEPLPAKLSGRLLAAVRSRGTDYQPRTRHLDPDGAPKYTNRLILQSSPYLLQHAHNPVNWYPWSDEAFEHAREQGKPVLLSVGYATCHWCHVMEEESFENEAIASMMNEHYVAIKVDREQRPDVDAVYMAAVRRLSGSGGWPMTVWLTADRKPFYGGTYFPPRRGHRGSRPGFNELLLELAERYHGDPTQVLESAAELSRGLGSALAASPGEGARTDAPLTTAFNQLNRSFDSQHGGFGRAPKFPRTVTLEFLLRYHRRSGNDKAKLIVERTLERMARGGIYDHVGGGFHRYSTDSRWLVPHFEKMLYDNALLTVAYLEGHQATGRKDFADVARDILRYILREMTAPSGGFFSATDADSEGEEGKFFVWKPEELESVLGPERTRLVSAYYGVTPQGNFEGATILNITRPVERVASSLGIKPEKLTAELGAARELLYQARAQRIPPLTDAKILVSWNGLMISAFARAAMVLRDPGMERETYIKAASRAATFILASMREGERLRRSSFEGRVTGTGFLDDYAFFAAGLLDLYEATGDRAWLEKAAGLHAVLEKHFWDPKNGGYFTTPNDGEVLLAREKPDYDGAEPSGNSVAILNLLRLYELTTDAHYLDLADAGFRGLGRTLHRAPVAVPKLLSALDFRLDRAKAIVIVTPNERDDSEDVLLRILGGTFVPNHVLSVVGAGSEQDRLQALVPLVAKKTAQKGRATAYVCENKVCALPTSDPAVFADQLATHAPLKGAAQAAPPPSVSPAS